LSFSWGKRAAAPYGGSFAAKNKGGPSGPVRKVFIEEKA
jgi:hypothetical protein